MLYKFDKAFQQMGDAQPEEDAHEHPDVKKFIHAATGLGWRAYDYQVNEQSQLLEYGIAEF
jgi:hypothetical protein